MVLHTASSKPRVISVCIFEDSQDYREGIRAVVDAEPDMEVRGAWVCPEDGLKYIPETLEPDVVIMDIDMPGMSGVECARIIKDALPDTQILMLTVFETEDRIFQSLESGASGYILKSVTPGEIIEAIREIYNGGAPMSASIARKVVRAFRKAGKVEAERPVREFVELTRRENEVLQQLAKGYLYKEIAEKLFISLATVRTHIHNIYEKLHVRSRTEAVLKLKDRQDGG